MIASKSLWYRMNIFGLSFVFLIWNTPVDFYGSLIPLDFYLLDVEATNQERLKDFYDQMTGLGPVFLLFKFDLDVFKICSESLIFLSFLSIMN